MYSTKGAYTMTDEAKAKRRAYRKAWNAANKDKVKAAQERYWEKKAAADKAQDATQ